MNRKTNIGIIKRKKIIADKNKQESIDRRIGESINLYPDYVKERQTDIVTYGGTDLKRISASKITKITWIKA